MAQWTLERLYEQIFSGSLPAGAALGEIELTEQLGVSRSPVREALRDLETQGLVVSSAVNGRRIVASFGVNDIRELYTVRRALERLAHEEAAKRVTDDELQRLKRTLDEMEAADPWTPEGRERHFEADFRFHEIVCRAARLPRLSRLLDGLWLQTRALLKQLDAAAIYPGGDELSGVRADHRSLLDALRMHDVAAAGEVIDAHLNSRQRVLVSAVEGRGGLK